MNEETLMAYLAGCMDSDGYFTIRRDTRSMNAKGKTPTHVAMIGLRQVTPQVPLLLKQTFGGSLSLTKSTALNGRPLHGWHATAIKAAVASRRLLPYLQIKPRQAELLVVLQNRKGAIRILGSSGVQRVTPDELASRDAIWTQVRDLNRTGI